MTTPAADHTLRPPHFAPDAFVTSTADHGADAQILDVADSAALRFTKRFALIALALYHAPLFINNYPSLGGGGFNDSGLAVKWGHVFTPPFIWLARHLFHMTGPMVAARAGDNGDTGEEFARLLASVVIGLIAATAWTWWDRRRPRGAWVDETTRVLLRYSIALGIASYGVAKLLPMQFGPLSPSMLEQRFGDLRPMSVLWQFMEYSRPYAFFGGVMELVAVVLLCFRRTATLGAIICLAVMSNVMLLNYAYDVPVKLYATMIVVSAGVLALYDLRRMTAVFFTNRPAPEAPPSFIHEHVSAPVRWALKILAVGSVIVSSVLAMRPAIASRPSGPLNGAWVVTSFARNGQSLDATGDVARWRRLVVDGNAVMIRLESDSVIGCGSKPTDGATWTLRCARGRAGTMALTRTGDLLHLDGTFDGAPIAATARAVNRDDYPILRGGFHLIFDR